MIYSREYVGYLAKQIVRRLKEGEFIDTPHPEAVAEKVNAAMHEELALEDRINEEVRAILEAYSDEARQMGADYQETFKRVKMQLVKKYKAVL
jgi:hypothetical protein